MTTKMKKRTRAEAKKLMWEYYRDNKHSLPNWVSVFRDQIIDALREGHSANDAFHSSIESVS